MQVSSVRWDVQDYKFIDSDKLFLFHFGMINGNLIAGIKR